MATYGIWHGYLLGGSGSNIYTANVAAEWVRAGHRVIVMCQEPHPERSPFVHDLEVLDGETVAERRTLHPHEGDGHCTMVRPDVGSLLPVYCLDRYEGFDVVKRFVDLAPDELDRYISGNRAAMRSVVDRYDVDGVLVNHVVMGPPSLRPVLDEVGVPYTVKVHGSELEYAIAENRSYVDPGRAGLAGARRILAGSEHIARRTIELLGADCCGDRIEIVPPGVDMTLFAPVSDRRAAARALVKVVRERERTSAGRGADQDARLAADLGRGTDRLVERLGALHGTYQERDIERGVANALERIDLGRERPVIFVGKAIRQKGAQLLFVAWPLVAQRVSDARLIVTGFGLMREGWQAIVTALGTGDRDLLAYLVAHGSALDGGPDEPLQHLLDFLLRLDAMGRADGYFAAARGMHKRVLFTGQVDHAVLSRLWPLCSASVVPSIFPEAFGMVSAEAAACGCLPVVAEHSGLADVAGALRAGYPGWARDLVGFSLDSPNSVEDLAGVVSRILELPEERRLEVAAAARSVVDSEWSWGRIARRIERALAIGDVLRPRSRR